MLHICPRLPGQAFVEPPFEEEILAFLRFLRYSGAIRRITDVNINKLHQPWRSFAAIINKCLTGKSSGYDGLRPKTSKGKQPATTFKLRVYLPSQREEGQDEEDKEDELHRDVNINLGRGIQIGVVHQTQEFEDSRMTLTPVNPDGQQQSSSVSSQFVTSMLNPIPDAGIESIFETTSQMDVQTPTSFAGAISSIPGIVHRYMDQRMNKAVKVAVQLQSDRLHDEAQKENNEFLMTIDENMQKIIKENVKEQVKKMEGNKSIHRSNEQRKLYKALIEAYESDKIILDTYGDTVTLKRRRDDDADKDEEPFAGSDLGSKRRREEKEPESASTT
nr:hypothetical protein [Tanacetum cinerariifolium]